MGLGHFGGGIAAARWLACQGARVTVTDLANPTVLADALASLADVPIEQFHLGEHREDDFRNTDLVVVNPAVRPGNRFVEAARNAQVPITTEIEIFISHCPGRIVGVTGSNGKSTTAAMTAAILQAAGRRTWLGGNIGGSLLEQLPAMTADDWVVLELSSFQLTYMRPETSMPHVAIVTNCTPNHLDWHGCYCDYVAAKQRMLQGQRPDDLAVLNTFDPEVGSWRRLVRGLRVPLVSLASLPKLPVPGEHNRTNAACATTAALAVGCDAHAVEVGLTSFSPLPQRLEQVALIEERRFLNDSSATTPESTIVALQSVPGPIWLLAGGADKGCDFHPLAAAIARHAAGAAFFGTVRNTLHAQVVAERPDFPSTTTETMAEALAWCWHHSQPGAAILLSPACSSHDQFQNFRQRGEQFTELVQHLAAK